MSEPMLTKNLITSVEYSTVGSLEAAEPAPASPANTSRTVNEYSPGEVLTMAHGCISGPTTPVP